MTELAVRRWSTDDVRFDERLSYWTEAVSRAVFGVTCKAIGRGTFRGSISVAPLDGLHVALSEGSDRSNARTAADISADTDYTFFMFASFDAPWVMNWRGNPFKLEAGDVFFGDTRQVQAAPDAAFNDNRSHPTFMGIDLARRSGTPCRPMFSAESRMGCGLVCLR